MTATSNVVQFRITVLDRLKASLGSYGRVATALGVEANYPTRWHKAGYIPEIWALDVHELFIADHNGPITVFDVLIEARDVRRAKVQEAMAERE